MMGSSVKPKPYCYIIIDNPVNLVHHATRESLLDEGGNVLKQISRMLIIFAMLVAIQASVTSTRMVAFVAPSMITISLPKRAGFSDVSDQPLNLKAIDLVICAKMPIKPAGDHLVIAPGLGVSLTNGEAKMRSIGLSFGF